MITFALSKGRIYDQTVPLLKAAGVMARGDPKTSRKLIMATARPDVRLIRARLVVTQAALKVKRAAIRPLFDAFARAVS